jgi:hypothetical protein
MKMYGGEDAMWTALQLGEIDITDWPLTTTWRNTFSTDTDVVVVSAGGEAGFYTVDFNYNPEPRMGNPPGSPPNRPNPVYDQVNLIPPISNNAYFRLGVGHLFDRATFSAFLGAAGVPILSPVPSCMGGYIWPGLTGYTYNRNDAEAQFALGKIKQDTTTNPWTRYWDRNDNDVVDAGEKEACVLKMTWRQDAYRKKAGVMIYTELLAMNFTFNGVLTGERTGGANYQQVMLDKNYHITTLGWIFIGPDPDFLYDLYHINNYWDDPGSGCPNTAALNDSVLNSLSEQIKFALNAADARAAAWLWQERFEAICAQIPLFSNNAYKAHSKWYTGGNDATIKPVDDGENLYRRKGDNSKREWLDIANQAGFGDNSWFTLINAYPNCTLYGAGNMTLRYGWKEQQYPKHINPFYSDSYWDGIVLRAMYDSLGYRDPYDLSVWKGDLVKSWTVGVWYDSVAHENKSKVTVTLRPDAKFQDGTPVTIADVIFSLVGAGPLLIAEGYAPPWWWPTGSLVKSYNMIDAYTVEVLYDVQSFLAVGWTLGGFYIVPKHIWKPIIETGNPSLFAPDVNLIGSGPFRYKSMVAGSSLVMVANKPGSVVKTDFAGSASVTSPGYRAYCPVHVNVHADGFKSKIILTDPNVKWSWVNFTVTSENLWSNNGNGGSLDVNKYVYLDSNLLPSFPVDRTLVRQPDGTIVPDIELLQFNLTVGRHNMTVAEQITGPAYIDPDHANPWLGQWINVTLYVYVAWEGDITGRTLYDDMGLPSYPYKSEVPTPDFKVDIQDISRCSSAFISYPGHPKWDPVADVNKDYRVNGLDLNLILKYFSGFSDVAVTNLTSAKTVICQGYGGNATVTVQNQGNFTETFNVTAYANSTVIGSENVTLTAGSSATVTFTWNTSGFAYGDYTISAVADTVPGEMDTANNNMTDGMVLVTLVGDVNGDGKVRIDDVLAVAQRFGTDHGGPPNSNGYYYDANCDITNDAKIRIDDVLAAAQHFGQGP